MPSSLLLYFRNLKVGVAEYYMGSHLLKRFRGNALNAELPLARYSQSLRHVEWRERWPKSRDISALQYRPVNEV